MESIITTKFGILNKQVELREYRTAEFRLTKQDGRNEPLLRLSKPAGTLLKIFQLNNNGSARKSASSGMSTVQILDFVHKDCVHENLYECPRRNVRKVSEDLWPYIISIADPARRLEFCQGQKPNWVLYLKIKDLVSVPGARFGQTDKRFDCVIRYIGPVPELNPVGYFFGLELLHLDSGFSPQENDVPFTHTYMRECEPSLSLFITSDWLTELPTEAKKKLSPFDIITDTIERVRTAIGPATCLARSTSYVAEDGSTTTADEPDHRAPEARLGGDPEWRMVLGKNSKATKTKRPTAQFYAETPHTAAATTSDATRVAHSGMDRKGTLGKSASTSRQGSRDMAELVPMETDDYKQSIENREMNLLRQHNTSGSMNGQLLVPPSPSTTSMTPSPPMPPSILKNRSSSTAMSAVGGINTSSSPSSSTLAGKHGTIMSLEDRDIIVIDKMDIRESTKNEASVIVLNSVSNLVGGGGASGSGRATAEVDLADLLGSGWPTTAGDAGAILNKNCSESASNSLTRNKSPNLLRHFTAHHNNNNNSSNHNTTSGNNNNAAASSSLRRSTLDRTSAKSHHHTSTGTTTTTKTNGIGGHYHGVAGDAAHQRLYTEAGNVIGRGAAAQKHGGSRPAPSTGGAHTQSAAVATTAPAADDFVEECSPLQEVPNNPGLGVGSMVEVTLPAAEALEDVYGVIRWIGIPPGAKQVLVGVELEEDHNEKLPTSNGSYKGVRVFRCPVGRALFVAPEQCVCDKRFSESDHILSASSGGAAGSFDRNSLVGQHDDDGGGSGSGRLASGGGATAKLLNGNSQSNETKMFGHVECPPVPGAVAPLKICHVDALQEICGKFKGIQGHHNSCYLDATLFAMFTFTSVFDSLLFRPPGAEDISHYTEVQKVLREEIVNPLRKNVFVRADRVMKLRKLLDKLSSVSGLTSEEKDPEEFLNSLLAQIMRVEPFLKLSSGQDAYFYQLFVEKDERLAFPTVQQLFEQSFHSSDIKLKEVPSCLIIQMPRFGKNFKMYPRILPSQMLDVTDIIEDSPRQCSVCGKLADYECRDCFGNLQDTVDLESTAFCCKCLETVHMHSKRANHKSKPLSVPQDFRIMAEHMSSVPRLFMELFAVVCIETSHYVAFVKAGFGPDAPWCFFDSMADRKGERNGYNIPEMIPVPELPQWLSDEGARTINETSTNDKMLPEHAKRLFCDAYMCMYQSTDVMMYR